MLRKRKKQLRYAADQIISNPRRTGDDDKESQQDVVHLKRREVIEARTEHPRRKSKEKFEPASKSTRRAKAGDDRARISSDSESDSVKSKRAVEKESDSTSTLSQVVDAPQLELLELEADDVTREISSGFELPHPDDATVEFDELDELLLAEEDEELEEAIRRRLRTQKNRELESSTATTDGANGTLSKTVGDDIPGAGHNTGHDGREFEETNQRLNDLEKEHKAAQREVAELRQIASQAQQDRQRIQQQAEYDRRQVAMARQEQAQIQQSAERDRLLAEKARKDQIEIRQRAERERAQLKDTIESIREKSQKAEAERLAVLESIEQEREQLSQKLEQERELARQAAEQRQGLLQKTEQQRKEVRAAMEKQQSEARQLAQEAARLDDEAKALEKERLDIVHKAQQERSEAERLLEKEREQVRLVGEQWREIAQRAAIEGEKIRKLVDTDSLSATPAPSPDEAGDAASTDAVVTTDSVFTVDASDKSLDAEAGPRDVAFSDAQSKSRKLAEQEKQERALREQALREQTKRDQTVRRKEVPEGAAAGAIESPAADLTVDIAPSTVPTPNRFTDDSGSGRSVAGYRAVDVVDEKDSGDNDPKIGETERSAPQIESHGRTGSRGQVAADATKVRETDGTSSQSSKVVDTRRVQPKSAPVKKDAVVTGSTASGATHSTPAKSPVDESIPVLESKAVRTGRSRSAFVGGDGLRSMALAAAVFLVVLVGSSFAFFGYLNLDSWLDRETAVSASTKDSDQSVLVRIGQRFVDLRSRVFGAKDRNDDQQLQLEGGETESVETPMLAENAPVLGAADQPASVPVVPAPRVTTQEIANDVLSGRVVSDSGDTVAGITITALARKYFVDPKGSSGGVNYRTRTDEDGNFSLRVPPGEEYRVVSEGNDQFAPASARLMPGGDRIDLAVEALNGDLSVTGRIFTDSLDPIASARATTQFEPMQEVYSDDDGVYSIKVKRPTGGSDDTLVLRFEASGFHDGIMHLPANVWKAGKSISHDVFLDAL